MDQLMLAASLLESVACILISFSSVTRLTSWLIKKEVAHNVFLCPGEEGQPARVLVWPRQSVLGAKDPGAFAMAVCELSGQVLVYEESEYNYLTEDAVTAAQVSATENLFEKL